LKNYDLAVTDLRKVNRLVPDYGDAFLSLGWYSFVQGKFSDARKPTEKACQILPESMAANLNLGHIHLFHNEPAKAREYYEKALTLITSDEKLKTGPASDFILFNKNGWCMAECNEQLLWMRKEFKADLPMYTMANSCNSRAEAYFEQGQYAEAAEQFALAVATEEKCSRKQLLIYVEQLYGAGKAYEKDDDFEKAEQFLKETSEKLY